MARARLSLEAWPAWEYTPTASRLDRGGAVEDESEEAIARIASSWGIGRYAPQEEERGRGRIETRGREPLEEVVVLEIARDVWRRRLDTGDGFNDVALAGEVIDFEERIPA